jgi:DNA-directed RNA polymerase subunit H
MDLGLMPKHTLLSDRQAKRELKSLNIDYERLPLIAYADAAIQYLIQQGFDVSVGDVVKITRRSDTVGEAFYYRKVVL